MWGLSPQSKPPSAIAAHLSRDAPRVSSQTFEVPARSVGERRSLCADVRERPTYRRSHVVVEEELVRRGPQARGLDLLLALVVEPHLDRVAGEDVALEQKLVVALQRVERLLERRRHARHVLQLL